MNAGVKALLAASVFVAFSVLAEEPTPETERIAALIRQLDGALIPAPRFGASDCSCETHLFYFARQPGVVSFQQKIRAEFPDDAPLQSLALFPKSRPIYNGVPEFK